MNLIQLASSAHPKVLFFNHTKQQCGVYQYGKRLYDILKKTDGINYIYIEIENETEYRQAILNNAPNIHSIIYNYHCSTMSWLNESTIQKKVKNIGIPHESPEHLFDIICNIDPTAEETVNRFSIPRPIYENVDELLENYKPSSASIKKFIEYSEDGVPIFGSFGFGFLNKGFDKIIKIINEQFDAAIIKFVIPVAYFDPNSENTPYIMEKLCEKIGRKLNIKLMITHEFFSSEDLLLFLKSNTMNIFLYDNMHGRGVSSTIDYALSVKKPLGISDSYMFKNIYSDEICLYKNSVNECMEYSAKYCEKFLNDYSNKNTILKFNSVLKLLGLSPTRSIIGILPLGGNATRMNNLPKFLLPCNIGITLLDNIINIYKQNDILNIVAGVSDMNDYILKTNKNKIDKIIVNTKTMSETVYKLMNYTDGYNNNNIYKNILIMPDTYFKINNEIKTMVNMLNNYDIVVLVWKIKDYQIGKVGQCKIENNKLIDVIDKDINCEYEYFWGSIGWNSNMNKYINPEWETIGQLLKIAIEMNIEVNTIICNSNYYDCGTYLEYFTMIKNEI